MTSTNQKYLQIEIGGVDYSKYLSFPFVMQDIGTEQLSTAIVSLFNMPTDARFAPFTPVNLCGYRNTYVIANDAVKEIFGKERWNHELTLIDSTKASERTLMEAKAFTQPIYLNFTSTVQNASYFFLGNGGKELQMRTVKPGSYVTPNIIQTEGTIVFPSIASSFLEEDRIPTTGAPPVFVILSASLYYSKNTIVTPDIRSSFASIYTQELSREEDPFLVPASYVAKTGIYTVIFDTYIETDSSLKYYNHHIVPLAFVNNSDLIPRYTLYDVLTILLDTAEPLRLGLDTSRYTLDLTAEQEAAFKNTVAPELHFSNGMSLMENLSQIGKYIHCLPRIDNDNKISFRELGTNQRADLSKGQRFGHSEQFNASDYASTLEANFANLINADDELEGSVTEPYNDGFISLRSEKSRIKEGEDALIQTRFPIAKIKRVLMRYHNTDGSVASSADITKYVFEKSEYELLSGFSGIYPFSKTFAIYYTIGSKNIEGLWYRVEDESIQLLNAFKKYAIENIASEALGLLWNEETDPALFMRLSFQITYVPIINGRARQEKTETLENKNIVLAHNQSAKKMSAKAFGENLRGQVAMMANATESVLYMFKDLADIPRAGLLYDDDSFISSITTRVFPNFCISQIDLSKNFNDLGAYVELKNDIRQYEIPQGETRMTLIEEYCEIGTQTGHDENTICCDIMKSGVMKAFDSIYATSDITAAIAVTYNDNYEEISHTLLPVFSTSLGTSAYFGFSFEDNYSAGAKSVNVGAVAYRGMEYVNYGDEFFARAKYLKFNMGTSLYGDASTPLDKANALPSAYNVWFKENVNLYATTGIYPLVWNKDAADSGNVAYQLHFVSNDGYVICPELARSLPFVRAYPAKGTPNKEKAKIYFYDHYINNLTGSSGTNIEDGLVGVSEIVLHYSIPDQDFSMEISSHPQAEFLSWVIKREDNACLIGKNDSKVPEKIYFNFKRKR
jgi:hypothetical protein